MLSVSNKVNRSKLLVEQDTEVGFRLWWNYRCFLWEFCRQWSEWKQSLKCFDVLYVASASAGFESYLAADAIKKSVSAVNRTITETTENPNATANVKVLVETIQKVVLLLCINSLWAFVTLSTYSTTKMYLSLFSAHRHCPQKRTACRLQLRYIKLYW